MIARSTFAGSGRYTGHWGGDNYAGYDYMTYSIPQGLQFSLYGIPMFGVDTCGFIGDTTEELCNRWMQLSAFFPFYRNHNIQGALSQEPYRWASVAEASKTAMAIRYALLPYMYTLFYLAHTTGSTVMPRLAWEFSNDPALAAIDRQFSLRTSLMIIPVLDQGAVTVNGVFPGSAMAKFGTTGTHIPPFRPVPTSTQPLMHHWVISLFFVRGGSVLPMQQPALLTKDVRNSPWSLLVALDQHGSAQGQVYVDDGESVNPSSSLFVNFSVSSSSRLTASPVGSYRDTNPLANITVLGVHSAHKRCCLIINRWRTVLFSIIRHRWCWSSTDWMVWPGVALSVAIGAWHGNKETRVKWSSFSVSCSLFCAMRRLQNTFFPIFFFSFFFPEIFLVCVAFSFPYVAVLVVKPIFKYLCMSLSDYRLPASVA